jgi:hypothetical protein
MPDAQVTISVPVLQQGSQPDTGPTVVKHLQLMLNERGGFPVLVEDGNFGPSTEKSVKHYQQNEKPHCQWRCGAADVDFSPIEVAPAVGTWVNPSQNVSWHRLNDRGSCPQQQR